MKKVSTAKVASPDQAMRADLPKAVQASLGELAGAAREGLPARSPPSASTRAGFGAAGA